MCISYRTAISTKEYKILITIVNNTQTVIVLLVALQVISDDKAVKL